MSARAHLEQVEKSTGKTPDGLTAPPFPEIALYVWETFNEIHSWRSTGGMGLSGLSATDVQAWCNLFGIRLSWWELETIKKLDSKWVSIMSESENGG